MAATRTSANGKIRIQENALNEPDTSMSHIRSLSSLLLLVASSLLHAQTVQWMRQGGLSGEGRGIASDAAGNAYVCGTVGNPALFDLDTTASHFADAFVAKYDDAGTIQWVRTGGNELIDQANAIATDADGNSYVTGFFRTNGPFPTVTFDSIVLQGLGSSDLFLAKYAADGTLLWIRSGGGAQAEEGRGVALAADGNVLVSGFFQGTAVFAEDTLVSGGLSDVLLLKYSTDGDLLWSARCGGTGDDMANQLTALPSGDLAVVGFFQAAVTIGSTTLTANGLTNAFIARYAGTGDPLWATSAGSNVSFAGDQAYDIDAAPNGDLVICGEIAGTADFDGTSVVPNGGIDLFIARYDGSGALQWVHHAGGPQVDHAYGVAVDSDGNSYLTGQADDGATTVFDTITLAPFGNEAVFLAKYDAAGAIQWVERYTPGLGRAVEVVENGCLYFTGGASGIVGQPAFDAIPWQYMDRAIFTARFCADQATTVAEPSHNEEFALFPNPSNGQSIHVQGAATLRSLDVFDPTGRLIAHYNGTVRTIAAPEVTGTYFVRAVQADGRLTTTRLMRY